jgi:hypothetical protein
MELEVTEIAEEIFLLRSGPRHDRCHRRANNDLLQLPCRASPPVGSGSALERTDNVFRDPAAVEISVLAADRFVVHVARIDAAGIKRHVVT